MDAAPFRIRVYDGDYNFLFQLGDPLSVSVTPRHLAIGTGSLSVALQHNRASALLQPGVRTTIDYLTGKDITDDASWLRVMSGPLWSLNGQGPSSAGVLQFGIEDDIRWLANLLGWQVPTDTTTSGTMSQSATAYDVKSGPAETVVKWYVSRNKGRLVVSGGDASLFYSNPITVATDLARGGTVKAQVRMNPLADVLFPLALNGGIGLTLTQDGAGLVFDCYEPTDRTSRVLTEASGAVLDWNIIRTGPAPNQVVVGGGGDGTARTFTRIKRGDSTNKWPVAEGFVDASDTSDATILAQRGNAALDAGVAQAGFALTVGETDVVKYGKNLFVGDLVAVQITPDLVVEDILSQATLTWTKGAGLQVVPQVGAATAQNQPDALLARAISRVAAAVRKKGSDT